MDANQRWDVNEAISYMKQLAKFKPVWIEEPTSPDDVLGKVAKQIKLVLCYNELNKIGQHQDKGNRIY